MNILKSLSGHSPDSSGPPARAGRFEIVLSGLGGQGIILAGKILAEAGAIYDNKEVVMTQSYGAEARGGASRAEVIISPDKIDYPKIVEMNVLLAMSQESLDKHGKLLSPAGLLVADERFANNIPAHIKNIFKAPFSLLAVKQLNALIVANIIALGSLVAITEAVSREALVQALADYVPKKVLELNRAAVDIGFKVAEESGFRKGEVRWRK